MKVCMLFGVLLAGCVYAVVSTPSPTPLSTTDPFINLLCTANGLSDESGPGIYLYQVQDSILPCTNNLMGNCTNTTALEECLEEQFVGFDDAADVIITYLIDTTAGNCSNDDITDAAELACATSLFPTASPTTLAPTISLSPTTAPTHAPRTLWERYIGLWGALIAVGALVLVYLVYVNRAAIQGHQKYSSVSTS